VTAEYKPNEFLTNDSTTRPVAPPGATYTFIAGGAPKVKERPRFTNGRTYSSRAQSIAETVMAQQYVGPIFEGPVSVQVDYYGMQQIVSITSVPEWKWFHGLRGDIDNYVKLTLDAMQKAGAFKNDSKVFEVVARKHESHRGEDL